MNLETTYSETFTAELDNLASLRRFAEDAIGALNIAHDVAAETVLAMNEAITNIIEHGYGPGWGAIDVEVARVENELVITLRDHAAHFDPTAVPEPDLSKPLDNRPPGGLGIFLMRNLVDKVEYRRVPAGENVLVLVKYL